MKMYTMAIGAGIGYLAGNQQARHKTTELFRQLKSSPKTKAVEEKVSEKVNSMIDLSSGRSGTDNAQPEVFTPGGHASPPQPRPSMVPH
jgi:hypothetical protein